MNRLRPAICALLFGAACGLPAAAQMALAPNDPAPPLQGYGVTNERVEVDWAAAPLTLVVFWATWCEPCRTELPRLQDVQAELGAERLQIYSIATDRKLGTEKVLAYAHQLGLRYPVLHDRGRIVRQWGGVGTMPTTFLIDDRGKILRRYTGATAQTIATMDRDVRDLLAGRPLDNLPVEMPEPQPSGNTEKG